MGDTFIYKRVLFQKHVKNYGPIYMMIVGFYKLFSPCRWRLPNTENSFSASTANDLRHDKYTAINSERFKESVVGLSESKFLLMRFAKTHIKQNDLKVPIIS